MSSIRKTATVTSHSALAVTTANRNTMYMPGANALTAFDTEQQGVIRIDHKPSTRDTDAQNTAGQATPLESKP